MNYKRISYFQYNPYSARIIFVIDYILKTEEIQEEKRKKKEEKGGEEERKTGRIHRDTIEGFIFTVKEYKW